MPADVRTIIEQAAAQYGVPPATLLAIAGIESNFDPQAHNPSGASGLFQFVPSTAAQYGLTNPYDPVASANAAARLASDNAAALGRSIGRAPTAGQIYLAHQQGAGGAAALINNPRATAASIVGIEAVRQNLPRSMQSQASTITAGQFANYWTSRADHAAGLPPADIPNPPNSSGSPTERAEYQASLPPIPRGSPLDARGAAFVPPPLPIPRPADAPPPGANAASWAQYTAPPIPRPRPDTGSVGIPLQLLGPDQVASSIPPSLPNAPFTVSYGTPPPQTDMLRSAIIGAMSHPGPEVLQPAANALAGLGNWLAPRPASSAPSVPALPALSNWADGYLNAPQNIPALPESANQTVFGQDVTPNYTTPTHQGLSPDDRQVANDALSTWNTGQGIAGTVGLPSGVRPQVTVPSLPSAPTTKTISVLNPAYTAWLNNQTPVTPAAPSPFSNPGVQGLSPDDRDSPDHIAKAVPGLTSPVFSHPSTPAPPKYVTHTVPVPRVPAPVTPLSPPPDELAALREQAQNPMQKLFGASPLGHITSFLGGLGQAPHYGAPASGGLLGLLSGAGGGLAGLLGGSQPAAPTITGPPIGAPNGYLYAPNSAGGYTHVGSVNPGLTPSQQYDAAAAKALASQPNPYLNFGGGGGGNPGGSTLAGRA